MPNIDRNRRAFLANSFSLAAGAGIMVLGLPRAPAYAQTPPKPIRRSERYDDSFITERKPFKWPGNNTLAVWFAPNVEVWHYDSAFGVGVAPNPTNYVPDVYNYAGFLYTGARPYGSVTFTQSDLGKLAPGRYRATLMLDDGYSVLAHTIFRVR